LPEARPSDTVTCHLDFNPENVLVDVDGQVCVVDWENSGAAFVDRELASVVAEFTRDPATARAFLAAYRDAGGPGRVRDASAFAMTFVVQANLVATYARRALDEEADPDDRRRAAGWVEDIAANVFTRENVEGWVAAARAVAMSA
jgi:thiamine kinase-like enzyme